MINLITVSDDIKAIPKKGSIFSFDLKGYQFLIDGDAISGKRGCRIDSKVKQKNVADALLNVVGR